MDLSYLFLTLKYDVIKTLRITKKNPVHWRETESEKDWYYSNLEDFDNNYRKGNKLKDVGSMIILKDINGKLPLRPHTEKFLFDNPNLFVNYKNEKKYLSNLIGVELKKIVIDNGFEDVERERYGIKLKDVHVGFNTILCFLEISKI